MQNKLVIFLLMTVLSCGKDVSIPNTLEKRSAVTQAESELVTQDGMIIKGDTTQLKLDDKSYKISKYSSHGALTYIAKLPAGESAVKFKGEVKVDEVVIQRFY